MITIFLRTGITYMLVFAVMRLMGKRQLSDMQPFDLVVSLLIADVASEPISDPGAPLFYGIVPVLTLFVLHKLMAFTTMRSEKLRKTVCGSPVVMIANGEVCEDALKAVNCTVFDLLEQLRLKDVFSISEVNYGILETNGSLSVLKKGANEDKKPGLLIVSDGKVIDNSLDAAGMTKKEIEKAMNSKGISPGECLYAVLEEDGSIVAQRKAKHGDTKPIRISMKNG